MAGVHMHAPVTCWAWRLIYALRLQSMEHLASMNAAFCQFYERVGCDSLPRYGQAVCMHAAAAW